MSDTRTDALEARGGTEIDDLAHRMCESFPRLSEEERRIALAVLREMGRGTPAEPEGVASRADVEVATVTDALERWPGVYRNEAGSVVGFWGLALGPMSHAMRVGERTLYGWCAWDTLFLPELLDQQVRVESTCAATGRAVRLSVGPDGVREVDPPATVVSFLDPEHCDVLGDAVLTSFCHHILFFASAEAWHGWAEGHTPETFMLTVDEAWRLGRLTNRLRYGSRSAVGPEAG